MENYGDSIPTTEYMQQYILEQGCDDLRSNDMGRQFEQDGDASNAPTANDIDLQSLSPGHYHYQHLDHDQNYPGRSDASLPYTYPSYEEQVAFWHAQSQAATKQFIQASTAPQPRSSSYQSSIAASRARQTSINSDMKAQHVQQTPRRASPAPSQPQSSPKPAQPARYAPDTAVPSPKRKKTSAPRTKAADQLVITKAGSKNAQPASAQTAANTSKRSLHGATSGMSYCNGPHVQGRHPTQPQNYSHVAPPPQPDTNKYQSRSGTPQNSAQHVQHTHADTASVSSAREADVVGPSQGMRGLDVAPKPSSSNFSSSDPSPLNGRHEDNISKPTTSSATPQTQAISFSVALSKDGLGHLGDVQFWESVDEYVQHSKVVSELHEKAKTFAKWVVHHDKGPRAVDNYNVVDEIDKLMQSLFHTEDPDRYNHQGVRVTQGRSVLRPEIIVQQLETNIALILSADPERLRLISSPSSCSVKKLKQDAMRGHIEFYQCRVQALALTVCHIVDGKQDSLVAHAMDSRVLETAKRGMQGTKKAVEAYYRGTASLPQKFYYMDELKNALSAALRKKHMQTVEEIKTDAAWLQAQISAAAELQLRLAIPKVGDLHLAPDLIERTLSHLDDITYQAHAELQQITQDTIQQKTSLGKHPRTKGDAEEKNDKEMMPPPPRKIQKQTKTPTKNTSPHKSEMKDYSFTDQAVPGSRKAKIVGEDDDVFIVGSKSILNPALGGTASQMPVQNLATDGSVQGLDAKPYPTTSTSESAFIPAAAMTKESRGSHSKPDTKSQPGHESGVPDLPAMQQGKKQSIHESEENESIDTLAMGKRPRLSSSPGIADHVTPTLEAGYDVMDDAGLNQPGAENLFASDAILDFDNPVDSHIPLNFGPWDSDLVDNRGGSSHDDWLNAPAAMVIQI